MEANAERERGYLDAVALSVRNVAEIFRAQPVRLAVELKLWQADRKTGYHFDNDKTKLEIYAAKAEAEGRRFTGLCIAFCHHRSDWRVEKWGASADGREDEATMELPLHGVRSLVISALA